MSLDDVVDVHFESEGILSCLLLVLLNQALSVIGVKGGGGVHGGIHLVRGSMKHFAYLSNVLALIWGKIFDRVVVEVLNHVIRKDLHFIDSLAEALRALVDLPCSLIIKILIILWGVIWLNQFRLYGKDMGDRDVFS